jgi:phenylalanyl-tRNA synthetase beta chain
MGGVNLKIRVENKAREIAEMCGFSQAYVYSFESPKVFDKLMMLQDDKERQAIKISNPLGEDFSVMRTNPLNGMLTSLSTNFNRRNPEVKLYELGNIYIAESLPITDYPQERMQFTLGFYGEGDFFTMKGAVEEFFDAVGMKKKREYDPVALKQFLHPGRQAKILYEGKELGYLGEVHPIVCANYDIKTRVYVAVIDMPAVMEFVSFDHKYEGIAKFPAVTRDLSMLVPKKVLAGQIETVFAQRGGKILEDIKLFDIYEGEQVAEGFKSVAYSLTFRAKDRTLEENDINAAMKKILNGLQSLGIELRS